VRVAHRLVRLRQSASSAFLQEMITGMTTIQLFNREATANRRYDEHNRGLRDAFLKSTYWFSFYFPSMELLAGLSIGLVLAVGTWQIVHAEPGGTVLTIGGLVAFINYVRDFFRPLEGLSDKSNVFQSAMASAERVCQLLDEPETLSDPAAPVPLQKLRGEIAFENVSFAYNDENWVLRDLTLRIKPGESVAIVGATGAGKSSIISLIARFYDVQKGAVKVDGIDVRDYAQADLRRRIGIVLQDPFMFAGKMADNIGLYNPEVGRDRIVEAAKRVNADGFITARTGGYDGEVLERGAGLSTGQKQLLALARAIAQDPDIVLILDEATANVDTETERLIQDALRRLMKGRTCIVIAHRLSTIRDADRIVCLRRGEIVEEGSHDSLIARDGYYRKLYELLSHEVR
jgi:ATP-binding cassette subfamily B protein